ncbi:lymphocyte antigen 86 [Microcaecilia unicolor]|uniref:Lymphocyte antigen 86 n=1 Tax=Microcaecilia unicolor TaxID=1415580 RepID=A0A6P7X088_9AMPH|nr:lymphocyte antigen 86 [Microcaecilia unicolor]
MNIFTTAVSAFFLFYVLESKEWPMHTICREPDLEWYYRSCDPLQDIGVSIEPCSKSLLETTYVKIALLLRRDFKWLTAKLNVFIQSLKVFSYSYSLCEPTSAYYTFCGRRKGELVYFEGPVKFGIQTIPQGEYNVSLELFNEDNYNIGCANITLISR